MPRAPSSSVWMPLKTAEIRVICLQPGSCNDPLVATLEHHPLQGRSFDERYERCDSLQRDGIGAIETLRSEDGYEAISYAWEEYDLVHKLYIQGKGEIGITRSLFAALQQFRWQTKMRRLWADAISINQTDHAEKAAQVAVMHTIFGGADMVLIWLGPARPGDELAFAMIRHYDIREYSRSELTDLQILNQVEDRVRGSPRCPCCDRPFDGERTDLGLAGLHAIRGLLLRSYFTRLWTVQEVDIRATPAQIFSGSHCAVLVEFIMAIYFLGDILKTGHLNMANGPAQKIQNAIGQVVHEYGGMEPPSTRNFWRSFTPFSRRNCSDPRDRIYAIRSCLGLEYLDDLAPDYTISTQECYRKLTWVMLQEENFPGLAASGPTFQTRYRLPWIPLSLIGTEIPVDGLDGTGVSGTGASWVPDLHRLSERSRDKLSLMTSPAPDELFGTNPKRFKCYIDPSDGTRIKVQGRNFATLSTPSLLSKWPRSLIISSQTLDEDDKLKREIADWYGHCKELAFPLLGVLESEALETFHRLLICGLGFSSSDQPSTSHQLLTDQLSEAWLAFQRPTVRPYILDFVQNMNRAFIDKDRYLCIVHNRESTDVSWVPKKSKAGDMICVFGGSPFPFVVRPRDDGSFKLLGDAYTARGTLKEALGSGSHSVGKRPASSDASMNWDTDDEAMLVLMDNLDWITLS